MVTCIEIWNIFLVQRDAGTTNQKRFQPVLNVFGFEHNSMNFEIGSRTNIDRDIYKGKFCCQKTKCKSSNWWKPSTKPSKEVKRQEIMEEKVGEKYSFEVQV